MIDLLTTNNAIYRDSLIVQRKKKDHMNGIIKIDNGGTEPFVVNILLDVRTVADNQLNVTIRVRLCVDFDKKKILVTSYFIS